MKVVILAGGLGTRLREETEYRPKPMVEIGTKPILWHIMKMYDHYGFHDFVICLGYKSQVIKEYFLNYKLMNSDFTVNLGRHDENLIIHNNHTERDWNVTLVETGEKAHTGARIKKIEKYINGTTFMVTYGDAVADVDIGKLLEFHKEHGKIGTVTGIHLHSRFGELHIDSHCVKRFNEKPSTKEYVNGGFFVFNRRFFSYLNDHDDCILENEPITQLTKDQELMVYPHDGFWQCCDTYRELELLNTLWSNPNPPWKVWK